MKFPKKFVFLLAVASGACWGTYGIFSRVLSDFGIDSATISMIVPLFYGLFFFVCLCLDDIRKIRIPRKLIPFLLMFGLGSAVFNFSTVKAYSCLPIGMVSTIIYCNLFLLMLFSRLLFKTPITWQKGVAAVAAVLGISMLLNIFSGDMTFSWSGIGWALLAMFAWAFAVTWEKYLLVKGCDGNAVMVYNGVIAVGGLCVLHSPSAVAVNLAQCIAANGFAIFPPLICFAVVTSILSYYFYITGLKYLETSYVQMGFAMDPLTSSVLGFLVLGQSFQPIQAAGIVLILFAIVWVQWLEVRKNPVGLPPSA